jgi:long-chain acyl-CoA synthetase
MFPTLIFQERRFDKPWFEAEVARVRAGLQAAGVQPGGCVAAMLRNCPAYVVLTLACRQSGIYLVPINWHFKAAEAGHLLADSGSQLLVVHADLLPQVQPALTGAVQVLVVDPADAQGGSNWAALGRGQPVPATAAQDFSAAIAYTSGTTGRPKGVRRLPPPPEQRAELAQLQREITATVFGLDGSSVALLSAPVYHSAPMSYLVNACNTGATLLLEAAFDAERTLALIDRHAVTHAYLVPTMFQRLLRLDGAVKARYRHATVKQVASTGSPIAPELKRAMIDWWGPVITEAYASSETGYISFIDSATWLAHPGSAGRPLGRARVRILGPEGQDLPTGQVGVIYARQPGTPDFDYINQPEARRKAERDGLVTLGDMGWLDAEGFLYVSDRQSDMVISGGVNIYPAEIEAALQSLPGVADCAVFGVPDDEFGEVLAAAVQPRPGVVLTAEQVQAHLRGLIANYKVPRQVEFHEALPREDTGKIFKRLLREPHWQGRNRRI